MLAKRSLLVVAHPGHELMLFGWLREARPQIVVLTDKESGATRSSLDLTRKVAETAGAFVVDTVAFEEAELFDMLLQVRTDRLERFVHELADLIARECIEQVVSDAAEGYHPVHDLSAALVRAAIALHTRRNPDLPVEHLEYHVVGDPRPDEDRQEMQRVVLSDAILHRKLEWIREYATELGPLMLSEVECLLDAYGDEAYRFEVLGRAGVEQVRLFDGLRHYEKREEQLKAENLIDRQVLRHARHMAAVEEKLHASIK